MLKLARLTLTALLLAPLLTATGQEPVPYSAEGADSCLLCHEDETVLPIFQTKHGVPSDPSSPFGQGQLQSEACHGPGGNHTKRPPEGEDRTPVITFAADDPTPVVTQNGMCLDCHESDVGFGWHNGAHAVDEVACGSCHSVHEAHDPVSRTSTQPAVCFDCHQQVRSQTMKAFAHPITQGKMDCTGCHSPHGDDSGGGFQQLTTNDTCNQCHAEKRGPVLWEHAPVSEDCGLCHEPHGSTQPGMLTKRAPLLCQSCHSQAGHPSVAFDTSGLPDGMPSQYLLGQSCLNCHTQVHGSNHPSGSKLMR